MLVRARRPEPLCTVRSCVQLDDAGAIEAAKQKRQEEIRARLAAGAGAGQAAAIIEDASVPVQQVAADYYSAEEMAKASFMGVRITWPRLRAFSLPRGALGRRQAQREFAADGPG